MFTVQAVIDAERFGMRFEVMDTSFFLGGETFVPSVRPLFSGWRERLFIVLAKNAANAAEFFCIPTNRLVELGGQVPI